MTNLNDLFARDMAFRDIVIETAARAIGSTSKEFAEEWLMAPHVDANDAFPPESDVIAGDVDASDANATQDSREKLEADVWSFVHDNGWFDFELQDEKPELDSRPTVFRLFTEWLDRQAAITRKTEQAEWIQQANGLIHEANVERDELREKVGEMTDEISELLKKQPYTFDPHDARYSIKLIGRYIAELQDELAKRDKGIARLKRQRDEARQELEKHRWEYCETCEHAEQVEGLEAERDKLKRKEKQLSNELGLRDKAIEMLLDVKQELIAERDNLAADLQDCERQRERLRQALGCAIDHAHEIVSLVTLDGEVIE